MPTMITTGAMSGRGFGLAGGSIGTFWWDSFSTAVSPATAMSVGIASGHQIIGVSTAPTAATAGYIVKLTALGTVITWQDTYTPNVSGVFNSGAMLIDGSDNIYLAGLFIKSGPGVSGSGIVEVAAAGSSIPSQYLADNGANPATSNVCRDSGGNLYWAGPDSFYKVNSSFAFQLGRLFSSGQTIVGVATDGTVIYTCGFQGNQATLTQWNASGSIVWSYFLNGGSPSAVANAVAVLPSGNVVIVGTYGTSALIFTLTSAGASVWFKTLAPVSGSNVFNCCATDSNGYTYVGGSCASGGLLVKYDTGNNPVWQRTIGTSTSDVVTGIALDGSAMVLGIQGNTHNIIARLPTDGSKTGTYGALTYAASSFTASAPGETKPATGYMSSSQTAPTVSVTITVAAASATITNTPVV